jgi:hypothetical protein
VDHGGLPEAASMDYLHVYECLARAPLLELSSPGISGRVPSVAQAAPQLSNLGPARCISVRAHVSR